MAEHAAEAQQMPEQPANIIARLRSELKYAHAKIELLEFELLRRPPLVDDGKNELG